MRRAGRAQIGQTLAGAIETDNKQKSIIKFSTKYHTRWQPGICKICGEPFQMITQDHAHNHGFRNADEMAKSDIVDWR